MYIYQRKVNSMFMLLHILNLWVKNSDEQRQPSDDYDGPSTSWDDDANVFDDESNHSDVDEVNTLVTQPRQVNIITRF